MRAARRRDVGQRTGTVRFADDVVAEPVRELPGHPHDRPVAGQRVDLGELREHHLEVVVDVHPGRLVEEPGRALAVHREVLDAVVQLPGQLGVRVQLQRQLGRRQPGRVLVGVLDRVRPDRVGRVEEPRHALVQRGFQLRAPGGQRVDLPQVGQGLREVAEAEPGGGLGLLGDRVLGERAIGVLQVQVVRDRRVELVPQGGIQVVRVPRPPVRVEPAQGVDVLLDAGVVRLARRAPPATAEEAQRGGIGADIVDNARQKGEVGREALLQGREEPPVRGAGRQRGERRERPGRRRHGARGRPRAGDSQQSGGGGSAEEGSAIDHDCLPAVRQH